MRRPQLQHGLSGSWASYTRLAEQDGQVKQLSPNRTNVLRHVSAVTRAARLGSCSPVVNACVNRARTNAGYRGHIVSMGSPGTGRLESSWGSKTNSGSYPQ